MLSVLTSARHAVSLAARRHKLFLANIGVSAGLSGLGDVLQQRMEEGRQVRRGLGAGTDTGTRDWGACRERPAVL